MCFMPKPKVPEAPPPPSDLAAATGARREARQRQAAGMLSGRQSTLLTGTAGADTSGTAKKTLLGA